LLLEYFNQKESLDFIIEEAIDFNTIGLLLGMMVIVAILGETGVFYWVGYWYSDTSAVYYYTDPTLMIIIYYFTIFSHFFNVMQLIHNITSS
jgi:Na+/H+ antiporter NhaD/arsenite permease-like protein